MLQLAIALADVPNVNGFVIAGGSNLFSRRRISNAGNAICGITQRVETLASGNIPDLYGPVLRTGCQMLAIRAEGHGENGVDVILKVLNFQPRGGVPEL